MAYGKLIVTFELTKEEAQRLEENLSKSRRVKFQGINVQVTDIKVGTVGHNVQYLTVEGNA